MKRAMALCLCFLLFLIGCSQKTAKVENEGFSCNVTAKFSDDTYHLFLEVPGGAIVKAKITEGELKGMEFTLDGEDVSVQFLGMNYTLPDGFFGETCITAINEVLKSLKRNGEEVAVNREQTITLDTELGKAKITIRPDGFPTKIIIPDQDAEIILSDFNYI